MSSRLAGLAVGGPPLAPRRRRRARGGAGSAREVIGAVAGVSAALRSGAPPDVAWRRALGVHADGGVPSWPELTARCDGDRDVPAALLAAGRLAARTGAPLADVLDRVGAAMARDAESAGQRTAALAGPRATARLLAWLPASGVVLGFLLGADPLAVLLDGGAGTLLLVLGALLTAAGRAWNGRCVRAALRAAGPES